MAAPAIYTRPCRLARSEFARNRKRSIGARQRRAAKGFWVHRLQRSRLRSKRRWHFLRHWRCASSNRCLPSRWRRHRAGSARNLSNRHGRIKEQYNPVRSSVGKTARHCRRQAVPRGRCHSAPRRCDAGGRELGVALCCQCKERRRRGARHDRRPGIPVPLAVSRCSASERTRRAPPALLAPLLPLPESFSSGYRPLPKRVPLRTRHPVLVRPHGWPPYLQPRQQ